MISVDRPECFFAEGLLHDWIRFNVMKNRRGVESDLAPPRLIGFDAVWRALKQTISGEGLVAFRAIKFESF
jgi:hypothetical protein